MVKEIFERVFASNLLNSVIMSSISRIKNSFLYKYVAARVHRITVGMNPRLEMNRYYRTFFGRNVDFEQPKDLIEKIYWMLLYSDTSLWSKCADKYAMREYVNECGCEQYLPANYGHWDKVSAIDFSFLPSEFVLKSNNGCGTVLVVKDKTKLDIDATKKILKQWLSIPFGWSGAQLHYTKIEPCIIAEELLHQDEELNQYSPESMVDFKVWCINGEPESVLIVYERNRSGYSLDLYDTNWNRLNQYLKKEGHFVFHEKEFQRPACLEEMLTVARKLSEPFPQVRVDFYVVKGKPVLGELTFTTGYGYFTDGYYNYLGSKIDLSKVKRIK